MDPEQTFIRIQERFSQMLTPRVRASLEYIYPFVAITLFCILVVMHANYVQQPHCSSEFSRVETTKDQLFQIKITSAGLWSRNESESNAINVPDKETATDSLNANDGDGLTFFAAKVWLNWICSGVRRGKLALKFWKSDMEHLEPQAEFSHCWSGSHHVSQSSLIEPVDLGLRNMVIWGRERRKKSRRTLGMHGNPPMLSLMLVLPLL